MDSQETPAQRRERITLEVMKAHLAGQYAFLIENPDELAAKVVAAADAIIARLDEPQRRG